MQRQAEHRQKCLEFKKSFIFLNDRKEGRVQKWCWMLSPEAVASEGSVRVEHGSSQCWLGSVARANSEVQQQEVWDSSVSSRSEGSQLWHASGAQSTFLLRSRRPLILSIFLREEEEPW